MEKTYDQKLDEIRAYIKGTKEYVENKNKEREKIASELLEIHSDIESKEKEIEIYKMIEEYLIVAIKYGQCCVCKKKLKTGFIVSYGTFCNHCYALQTNGKKKGEVDISDLDSNKEKK